MELIMHLDNQLNLHRSRQRHIIAHNHIKVTLSVTVWPTRDGHPPKQNADYHDYVSSGCTNLNELIEWFKWKRRLNHIFSLRPTTWYGIFLFLYFVNERFTWNGVCLTAFPFCCKRSFVLTLLSFWKFLEVFVPHLSEVSSARDALSCAQRSLSC